MALPASDLVRFGENAELYQLGLSNLYHDTLAANPNSYQEWLAEIPAKQFYKTEMGITGLSTMPAHDIGSPIKLDRPIVTPKKSYTMAVYAIGMVLQYEVFRWDLFGAYKPVTEDLAKTANVRYELVAYALFNNAFSTADPVYTDYRNEALCSVTHTRGDGGTWQNRPSSPVGLSMMALNIATTLLKKTVNDRGQFVGNAMQLKPKRCVTTTENGWLASILFESQYNPENNNMQYNNAKSMGIGVTTSAYITLTTPWFILCDKNSSYRIKLAQGDKPDLVKDNEPSTRNMLMTSYCSFRLEVYEAKGWLGDQGV